MRSVLVGAILIAVAGTVRAEDKIDRMNSTRWKCSLLKPPPTGRRASPSERRKECVDRRRSDQAGCIHCVSESPPNYDIPPHTHPFAEVVTILRGKLGNGMGEKFEKKNDKVLNAVSGFGFPPVTRTMFGRLMRKRSRSSSRQVLGTSITPIRRNTTLSATGQVNWQ